MRIPSVYARLPAINELLWRQIIETLLLKVNEGTSLLFFST